MNLNWPIFVSFLFFQNIACSQTMLGLCESSTYDLRSKEIQEIVKADQLDRKSGTLPPDLLLRDQKRRMRIGEIFGEGCLKSSADFSASALIYQHGTVPEHFFQTFLWSKRAIELGDPSQKRLMALGIDRFLVNIGKKQLFASQAFKISALGSCWCLQPIEETFPESRRVEFMGQTKDEAFKWVDQLNSGTNCEPAKECSTTLNSSPAGTVPGFW
jgi:hypothetical protein